MALRQEGQKRTGSFLTLREEGGQGADALEGCVHVVSDIFGVASYAVDGGRVFALSGELDVSTVPGLHAQLITEPGSLVVLDLSRLTFIDSSGLGAIHAARQRVIDEGGTLVVCRPNPAVHRVLEITGLDIWLAEWDPAWPDASAGT